MDTKPIRYALKAIYTATACQSQHCRMPNWRQFPVPIIWSTTVVQHASKIESRKRVAVVGSVGWTIRPKLASDWLRDFGLTVSTVTLLLPETKAQVEGFQLCLCSCQCSALKTSLCSSLFFPDFSFSFSSSTSSILSFSTSPFSCS